MIDELMSGLLCGLFGPALATWMRRFKYPLIFLVGMFGTHVYIFSVCVSRKGIKETIEIYLARGFDPVLVIAPMGLGVLAVAIAFVGSLSVPQGDGGKKSEEK